MTMNVQMTTLDIPHTPAFRTISLPPVWENYQDEDFLKHAINETSSDMPPLLFFDFKPFTPATPCSLHFATSYFSQCIPSSGEQGCHYDLPPIGLSFTLSGSSTTSTNSETPAEGKQVNRDQNLLAGSLFAPDEAYHPTVG